MDPIPPANAPAKNLFQKGVVFGSVSPNTLTLIGEYKPILKVLYASSLRIRDSKPLQIPKRNPSS